MQARQSALHTIAGIYTYLHHRIPRQVQLALPSSLLLLVSPANPADFIIVSTTVRQNEPV